MAITGDFTAPARIVPPPLRDPRVRVGIDVTEIEQVQTAIARFGSRYEQRLFTALERTEATGTPAVRAASLAARFAAKEAALKVLEVGDDPPPWTSIEVRRDPEGHPNLHLDGAAARMAADRGLGSWSVSLSHDGPIAAAVVAAMVAS